MFQCHWLFMISKIYVLVVAYQLTGNMSSKLEEVWLLIYIASHSYVIKLKFLLAIYRTNPDFS